MCHIRWYSRNVFFFILLQFMCQNSCVNVSHRQQVNKLLFVRLPKSSEQKKIDIKASFSSIFLYFELMRFDFSWFSTFLVQSRWAEHSFWRCAHNSIEITLRQVRKRTINAITYFSRKQEKVVDGKRRDGKSHRQRKNTWKWKRTKKSRWEKRKIAIKLLPNGESFVGVVESIFDWTFNRLHNIKLVRLMSRRHLRWTR